MRAFFVAVVCPLLLGLGAVVACSNDDPASRTPTDGGSGRPGEDGGDGVNAPPGTPRDGGSPDADAGASFDVSRPTMQFGGQTRSYLLVKPASYSAAKTYPLVMVFHGNPASPESVRALTPFENVSGSEAIVVYPQALAASSEYPGYFEWDIYTPTNSNADMKWISSLITEIKSTTNIDTGKVFAFGYSGGAFFVTHFACRFPNVLKAIASNAGGGPDEEAMGFPKRTSGPAAGCYICPGGPTPTLVTHGLNDDQVDPGDGYTATCFAATNGCTGGRTASTPAPCQTYAGCPADAPVKVCLVPGQDHNPWPQATTEAWSFFAPFR